jgi:hypothetical protein
MITTQADRENLIYLGMTHVLDLRRNTMRVGFDAKTTHVILETDKAALWQFLLHELQITL